MIPLRTSHVAFYAALVTLTVTVVVAAGFWFIRQQMLTGNDFLLDAESKEIIARIDQLPRPVDPQKLSSALQEHTQNDEALFYFQVRDAQKDKIIFRSANLEKDQLPLLTAGVAKRTVDLPKLGLVREAEYDTPAGRLQIAMSLRNFQTVSGYFWRLLLVGVPVIAGLSLSIGAALRRSTLRPMKLIQDTASRINASNLNERIPIPPGSGEMAALAGLLNKMFDRLERSFGEVKRFTADTSHELMTPLSIIRLHAERLLNDPELPARHRHSVEEQLQEALHLTETLERLMVLTKADSTILPLNLRLCATPDFISQFTEDAQLLAESRGLKFVLARNEGGVATFDQGWIRQVLFNLLSNALRFSPPGGTITLSSTTVEGGWRVEVMDEGVGVPEPRLQDIFGRFVQLAPRSEPGSGAGLGLAICKSIVQLHHGQISAHNRTDRKGLVVSFSVPSNTPLFKTIAQG
jgi:signal transduction histidine kinase